MRINTLTLHHRGAASLLMLWLSAVLCSFSSPWLRLFVSRCGKATHSSIIDNWLGQVRWRGNLLSMERMHCPGEGLRVVVGEAWDFGRCSKIGSQWIATQLCVCFSMFSFGFKLQHNTSSPIYSIFKFLVYFNEMVQLLEKYFFCFIWSFLLHFI